MAKARKQFGLAWQWEDNNYHSHRGRIWFGWKLGEVKAQVMSNSEKIIIMNVENMAGSIKFHIVVVYGLHTIQDRKTLWQELLQFTTDCSQPLIIIEDFNAVAHAQDRINGSPVTESETQDLNNFIMEGNVMKAPNSGLFYSWSNNSIGADIVSSRIDSAYVNDVWSINILKLLFNIYLVRC